MPEIKQVFLNEYFCNELMIEYPIFQKYLVVFHNLPFKPIYVSKVYC